MGFYFEMTRGPSTPVEFAEGPPPSVFWVLFLFGGFALTCMGLAAHSLLGDLARLGSVWDQWIVAMAVAAVPAYLFIGLWLGGVRKFVRIDDKGLTVGYRLFGWPLFRRTAPRDEVARMELSNHRPRPNLAPHLHDDPQYYVRGHWRVVAELTSGDRWVLDKHVEKEALEPFLVDLQVWHRG